MALFTDGAISTIEELVGYESSILDVATTEQIDLTVKLGLAQDELGIDLDAFLSRRNGTPGLGNVVVTEPLHKWHTFHTLAMVYRDAYHRQLNDRYLAKWNEYVRLGRWAWDALLRTGVGITSDPLPRGKKPQLSYVPAAMGAATYFVRMAWRNLEQEEGSPSDLAILTVPEGGALVVTAVSPPAGAVSWNVYVGFSAVEQTLQNDVPLGVNESWSEPLTGVRQGDQPGTGQEPEYYLQPSPQLIWG